MHGLIRLPIALVALAGALGGGAIGLAASRLSRTGKGVGAKPDGIEPAHMPGSAADIHVGAADWVSRS